MCLSYQIIFVCNIIIIDHLNKIWHSFQISFNLVQRFDNLYYLRTYEIFFLIYSWWWILSWSLKNFHTVHFIYNVYLFVTFTMITCKTYGIFFLIHLRWWILYWSLKYLHIVYFIFNVCSFVTFTKITCNRIKT
jgi:hypothetical protein